jgi:hypothetical protein
MGQTLSQQQHKQQNTQKGREFLVLELGFLANKINSTTLCRKTLTFLACFAKIRLLLDKISYILILSLQKAFKAGKIVE